MASGAAQGGKRTPFAGLSRGIGAISLLASRHAWATLFFILVVTLALGSGVTRLTTNVDVADVLPRGDGNTTAAKQLTKDFKSAFTEQVTLQFRVDGREANFQFACGTNWSSDSNQKLPNRRTNSNCGNITDEVYIRAIDQAIKYMRGQNPLIQGTIAISDLYRLINWTVAGGQDADPSSYNLPDRSPSGESRYRLVHDTANAAILSALDALSSPSWRATAVLLTPSPQTEASMAEIGRRAIAARDAYVKWAETDPRAFKVFTGSNRPLVTVELPVANAHSSELTKEDFSRLLPIIAGFILVCLYLGFRNAGATLIGFTSLALGVLWTYGAEGYLGIALNPLNLTLMPLIMGVGIDYSIHIVNEFLEHKAEGMDNDRAFREVGRRAGLALFVGTATTVLGLVVMIFSPSLLIAQFGALAAIAMATIFVLALTFIPAALTVWPGTKRMGASFRPSNVVAGIARLVTKGRFVVFVGVLAVTVLGVVGSGRLYNEAFGDPGRNYLPDDPVRIEHEEGLQAFYDSRVPDVKANVLVFQGDITTPEAHRYMRAIEAELKRTTEGRLVHSRIIADTLRTIPFLLETWLTVKDGGPGAVEYLARGRTSEAPYPATRDAIKSELDSLYASPMRELGSIFTNGPGGQYSLGVMTFSVRAATNREATEVWEQLWGREAGGRHVPGALDNVSHLKPAGMKIAFVGNTATNYLFVAKEVPFVLYMGIAATFVLMAIVIPFFRSVKAVFCVGLASFATTAWWLGLLPVMGIGMAITLVIPVVFIIALGSDYVVHLLWSFDRTGSVRGVFQTTGKAILFSWLTTIGPFLIFIGIQDLSVRRTMLATATAITIIFLVTILVVPTLYAVEPAGGASSESGPPSTETRTRT